jgi:hypothetical protein
MPLVGFGLARAINQQGLFRAFAAVPEIDTTFATLSSFWSMIE